MGRIVDEHEWKVIQKAADGLDDWNKKQVAQVEQAIFFVQKNKIEDFKKLLKQGLSLYTSAPVTNINGFNKSTILAYLAYHNKFELMKICDASLPNWSFRVNGFDPLDGAVLGKNDQIIEFLLDKRCYNLKTTYQGQSVKLIVATQNSYLNGVSSLLKAGANPELKDSEGHTALWHNLKIQPQSYEDIEIARLLLSYGAINPEDVSSEELDEHQLNVLEEGALRQSVDLVETPDVAPEDKPVFKPKVKIL